MRPRSRDDFAIAIICALPLEAEAVEALFDETYDRLEKSYSKQRGDANAYINGRLGKHDVVLCYMPGMGKGSAAGVVSSLLVSYPGVRLALVVGICGGAPQPPKYEEIFLGDVIISDSVIEYDFGRQYPGGFRRKTGVKDTLGRPDREIRALLNGLRAENARRELQEQAQQPDIFIKHYCHASAECSCLKTDSPEEICEEALGQDCDSLECNQGQAVRRRETLDAIQTLIYIGTIASADTVMKSGEHRDDIVRRGKVIGFEMEGAGVWDNVPCIIVKGVCDYADSHKNKLWQAYAAATGASAAKALLEYWMPNTREIHGVTTLMSPSQATHSPNTREIHGHTALMSPSQVIHSPTKSPIAGGNIRNIIYNTHYHGGHLIDNPPRLSDTNHADASKHHHVMIPFARNPHFVGRQEEIQKIEDSITVPHGPRKLAITGLGGVGKTQIALELAYRMRDREPECSIFWIPCTSYEAFEQACMSIAQMVGLNGIAPAEVKEQVQSYFSQTNKKWIFIFDNADETEMWIRGSPTTPPLKNIIPEGENGHVLFTSRNRQLALKLAPSNVVSVPDVDQKTGKEIFRNLLMRKDLLQDDHVTSTLLEKLAFLPLAISQAAAYINQTGISLATYMLLLGEQEASTIELLSEEFEDDGRYAEIQNPVATTWLVSFMHIHQVDQIASDYLSFMACINPRDIPESILPATTSAKRKVEALGLLKAYSFVSAQVDNGIFSLHRLVHLATRNWLRKGESLESWVKKAADQLDEIFSNSNHDNRQKWRDYLPHALYLVNSAEFRACQDNYHDFLTRTGSCLQSDGRHGEAEIVFRNVLEIRERACGPEHPDTLTSVSWLGSVLAKQGKYEEAEAMHRRGLAGSEKVLGPEHPDTLTSANNLGLVLADQGKYEEAEGMHQQALQSYKKYLHDKCKYEEAEGMHQQALQGREKVLGPKHPDTLTSMANLATIYFDQGHLVKAEELEVQVLESRKRMLGLEHPETLASMHSLAFTWKELGNVPNAFSLLKECANLRNKVLGADHPHAALSSSTLLSWETDCSEPALGMLHPTSFYRHFYSTPGSRLCG
ncbi:hypothetical protein BDV11DRAFT_171685 [Aspergillus similis]